MMILVIPDVHLKPWMFDSADRLLKQGIAEKAVSLGDIPDDIGKKNDIKAYNDTYDAAERFLDHHPDTIWIRGNHDMSYVWNEKQSKKAFLAKKTAEYRVKKLYGMIPEDMLKYVCSIDNVIFSHAGLAAAFVRRITDPQKYEDINYVIDQTNKESRYNLWASDSPLWVRPQNKCNIRMYMENTMIQIVGHTPVRHIIQTGRLISCDTFQTLSGGKPYGDKTFCLINTETGKWEKIPSQA